MRRIFMRALAIGGLVALLNGVAAPAAPALAGGTSGTEGCFPGSTCLPAGVCVVRDIVSPPVVVIGTGSGKFNIVVTNPSEQLLARCSGGGTASLEDEIPVDAADSSYGG
jgi:hypothetical protein